MWLDQHQMQTAFLEWNTVYIDYACDLPHYWRASLGFGKISPRYLSFRRLSLHQIRLFGQTVTSPAMITECPLHVRSAKRLISSHFFSRENQTLQIFVKNVLPESRWLSNERQPVLNISLHFNGVLLNTLKYLCGHVFLSRICDIEGTSRFSKMNYDLQTCFEKSIEQNNLKMLF